MFLIILAWIGNWQVGSSMGRPYFESFTLTNGHLGDQHKPNVFRHNFHTYIGSIDKDGNVKILDYNHLAGTHTSFTLHANFEVDMHDWPSILLRNDNRLIVFYCKHGGDSLRYRISTNPLDISSWGIEQLKYIGPHITYPNCVKLSGENDKIYLFFRGFADSQEWSYITSIDSGQTWSSVNTFFREPVGHQQYLNIVSDDDSIIHFFHFSSYTGNQGAYYFQYKNDSLYRINGTVVCHINDTISRAQMDTIYDRTEPGHGLVWRGNIVIDSLNNPYASFVSYTNSNHGKHNYVYWNGSSWVNNVVTNADSSLSNNGGTYWVGTIVIDPQNLNIVYFSKYDTLSNHREISKGITNDGGNSWQFIKITSNSNEHNFFPTIIKNHGIHSVIIWAYGWHKTYTNYDTDVMIHKEKFR